jgi:hypothetical protein
VRVIGYQNIKRWIIMGRPKGSKNKTVASVQQELQPIVNAVKAKVKEVKKEEKKAKLTVPTKDYIVALTELAIVAGRDFYLDKLQPWISGYTHLYQNLRIEVKENVELGVDEFTLYDGPEKLDTRHVFKTDIDDVVRGILGAR